MTMLFVMGIVMVFLAIALLGMAIAKPQPQGINRSLAVLEAMSSAPSELTADLNRPFSERVLDPLMGKATGLGKRLTGADTAERIRKKLDTAGNPGRLTVDKIIAGKVIGAVVGLIAAGAVTALLGTSTTTRIVILAAGVAVGFLAPNLYLYQVSYDRSGKMQRELPDAIDLMTISVESGLGFDAALQQVARQHRPDRSPTSSVASCARCRSARAAPTRCARSGTASTSPRSARSSARWCRPTPSASRSPRCCACSRRRSASSAASGPRRRRSRCP